MTRNQRLIDSCYRTHGSAAIYEADGAPDAYILIIPFREDELTDFGVTTIISSRCRFNVRRSQLPEPRKGARLTIGADKYLIKSEPVILDEDRLEWTMECQLLV